MKEGNVDRSNEGSSVGRELKKGGGLLATKWSSSNEQNNQGRLSVKNGEL